MSLQNRKIREQDLANSEDKRIIDILKRECEHLNQENEQIQNEIGALTKMKRSDTDTCKKNKKLIDAEHK